jgi:hypothetical protein
LTAASWLSKIGSNAEEYERNQETILPQTSRINKPVARQKKQMLDTAWPPIYSPDFRLVTIKPQEPTRLQNIRLLDQQSEMLQPQDLVPLVQHHRTSNQ